MRITTKQQMYDLLRADKLGNHFEWISISDFVRYMNKLKIQHNVYSVRFGKQIGAPWKHHLLFDDLLYHLSFQSCNKYGCEWKDISVVIMPLGIKPILQGELTYDETGLYCFHSFHNSVMRDALSKQSQHAYNLQTKLLLETFCDPSSYNMLMELLETYPYSVIEFSVYDRNVGVFPHKNTVVWEVRNY